MIKIGAALFEATEQIEREKGIPREVIYSSLKDAMKTAYKKHLKGENISNISAEIDEKTGEIGVFREKEVIDEEVLSEITEITIQDARKINPDINVGDLMFVDCTPTDFGRIAAQSAKQVINQRIREAERKMILEEFLEKKHTLTTGIIQRVEPRKVLVNIGRIEAILPSREQIPGEYYKAGNRIRVFVNDVKETSKLPQVIVSQTHPRIVQELFELEVPEIEDGLVEIVSIAREAGYRTKIAVTGSDPDVDPVGACIGPRGSRIQTIVNELKNEKIDIIRYSEDPIEYIVNALSPARIVSVEILDDSEHNRETVVVVPDDQLSLAIGKEGQNVRLAHRLTGWKIDIKSISQVENAEEYFKDEQSEDVQEELAQEDDEVSEEVVESQDSEEIVETIEEPTAEKEEIEEVEEEVVVESVEEKEEKEEVEETK